MLVLLDSPLDMPFVVLDKALTFGSDVIADLLPHELFLCSAMLPCADSLLP